ncbi:DUF397 domain-containing protein [Streptomyces sp. NPDC056159]|uniref:DUF397 domain-containing protein n=1 Tax=Streptomyces sp. NPDC056159 TaxID=3155537 RepID=UPI00343B3D04
MATSSVTASSTAECLEIAETPEATVAVRDSESPAGPVLTLAPAAFTEFLSWAAADAD